MKYLNIQRRKEKEKMINQRCKTLDNAQINNEDNECIVLPEKFLTSTKISMIQTIFTTRDHSVQRSLNQVARGSRRRDIENDEAVEMTQRYGILCAPHERDTHNLQHLHKRDMNNLETCALIMQGSTRKEDKPVMKILERRKRGYKYE